jgi:hypothetical protein
MLQLDSDATAAWSRADRLEVHSLGCLGLGFDERIGLRLRSAFAGRCGERTQFRL